MIFLPLVSVLEPSDFGPDPREELCNVLAKIRLNSRENIVLFLNEFFRKCLFAMTVHEDIGDFDLSLRVHPAIARLCAGEPPQGAIAKTLESLKELQTQLRRKGLEAQNSERTALNVTVGRDGFLKSFNDFVRRRRSRPVKSETEGVTGAKGAPRRQS